MALKSSCRTLSRLSPLSRVKSMQETDREEFTRILKGVLEVYGKTMSSDAWRIWWAALANSDLSAVRMALSKHVKESPYPPKPADILKLCTADDGRPGVEEA